MFHRITNISINTCVIFLGVLLNLDNICIENTEILEKEQGVLLNLDNICIENTDILEEKKQFKYTNIQHNIVHVIRKKVTHH